MNERNDNDDPDLYIDQEEFMEEETEYEQGPRRVWIRNTIMVLLVVALIGNILAFWPQIYNRETLPFLFKSQELSSREDIQGFKEAVVLVSTDQGKGTGFHISQGVIITNYHVIEGASYTMVKFPGVDREYKTEQISIDPGLDIAVLKVELNGQDLPHISIGQDRPWETGDPVYVIGNPLYFTQIVNEGAILGMLPIKGRQQPVMALDAPVFKGNSGSPVIDKQGQAIAVIYATGEIDRAGNKEQVGLAVPLSDAAHLLKDWLER